MTLSRIFNAALLLVGLSQINQSAEARNAVMSGGDHT